MKGRIIHSSRMLCFSFALQIAAEKGYNRLVLGSCTSRIASHVISATVKVCFSIVLGFVKVFEKLILNPLW